MAIAFALTALMTVVILVSVVAVVWQNAFSEYTRANVEEVAESTAERLAAGYEAAGGWTADVLTSAAASGNISDDIGMQVVDADGTILYDDTWEDSPLASWLQEDEEALAEAAASDGVETAGEDDASDADALSETTQVVAASDDEQDADGDVEESSPTSTAPTNAESIVSMEITGTDDEVYGTLTLWVVGSDALLTAADTEFRSKTFSAMALAAFVAITISIIIGLLASRMLTNPVRRITDTAKQIRDGNLSARTGMRGDDEIDRLGETFDEMAASMEKSLNNEKRLTSDVAHELRTPLMAMQATVEAMQDGVYPTDAEHLETVAAETRRLARLVQQTLDLSRMENHTTPLRLEVVDIVQLVRTIVHNQHRLFHEHDLHLRFNDETNGKGAYIEVDPDLITQAVINLMSNAMRYTPEGGWVVVSVREDRKNVMITVKDTGIGIAKSDLSRIFGRFWRADTSRAREAGGLGVGLSVTKQIVDRHEGFISVESELEKGSTFTIHLPRERTDDEPSSTMKR